MIVASNANKSNHIKHGNRKLTNYKIVLINKGNADFVNKQDLIFYAINDHNVDISFVSESSSVQFLFYPETNIGYMVYGFSFFLGLIFLFFLVFFLASLSS